MKKVKSFLFKDREIKSKIEQIWKETQEYFSEEERDKIKSELNNCINNSVKLAIEKKEVKENELMIIIGELLGHQETITVENRKSNSSSYSKKILLKTKQNLAKIIGMDEVEKICEIKKNLTHLENLEKTTSFLSKVEAIKSILVSRFEIDKELKTLRSEVKRLKDELATKISEILKNYSYNSSKEWKEKITLQKRQLELQKKQLDLLKSQPKSDNIEYLQQIIQELTNLIRRQKGKIVQAYTFFCSEKDLLRDLINAQLDFSQTKEQRLENARDYRKRFYKLYEDLESKLSEEEMKEVEMILQDCEELVSWEFELEVKQAKKKLSIEGNQKKNTINQFNIGKLVIDKGHAIFSSDFGKDSNLAYNNQLTELLELGDSKKLRKRSIKDDSIVKKARLEANDWTNIHSEFTNQVLIQRWLNNLFAFGETREWANVFGQSFDPQECDFYVWLRDSKQLTTEQTLNYHNLEQLKNEYRQSRTTVQIQLPPKSNQS